MTGAAGRVQKGYQIEAGTGRVQQEHQMEAAAGRIQEGIQEGTLRGEREGKAAVALAAIVLAAGSVLLPGQITGVCICYAEEAGAGGFEEDYAGELAGGNAEEFVIELDGGAGQEYDADLNGGYEENFGEDFVGDNDGGYDDGIVEEFDPEFAEEYARAQQAAENVDFGALFDGDTVYSYEDEGPLLDDVLDAEREEAAAAWEAEQLLQRMELSFRPADASHIQKILDDLADISGPAGSDGELDVCIYIEEYMEQLGYTITEQAFHEGVLNGEEIDLPAINIIAEQGANTDFKTDDIIILCAHYDSRGNIWGEFGEERYYGQKEYENPADGTKPQPDMLNRPENWQILENDKMGVAVLLEVARLVAQERTDLDICFLFLSGEEDGYFGSRNFADWLSYDLRQNVTAVLCLGTVGVAKVEQIRSESTENTDGKHPDLSTPDNADDPGIPAPDNTYADDSALSFPENAGVTDLEPSEPGNTGDGANTKKTVVPYLLGTRDGISGTLTGRLRSVMTQRQEDLKAAGIPLQWDTKTGITGIHSAFLDAGMQAAALFQDLQDLEVEDDEEMIVDIQQLRALADLITQTTGIYMRDSDLYRSRNR